MATDSEILGWLDSAIQDVLEDGQHISSEGDTYTKANLDKLMKWRIRINEKVSGASSSLFDRTLTGVPYRG